MSRVIENNAMPAAVREKLQSIRIRAGVVATVRAIAVAVAVLLVSMVVVMAADWWFMILNTGIRTTLTATTLVLAAFALLLLGIRPISEALGWNVAARNVDREIPQMQERWTTVASFGADNQPASRAEKAMLQQVRSEAVAMGTLVRPQEIVRPASLTVSAMLFGGAVAVFAVFMVSSWGQTSVLLRRFLHPTQHITATQLSSATGDLTVPRGDSVELVTTMTGLQRLAGMFVIEGESFISEQQKLSVSTDQPGAFVCSVDVDETFRYRMTAGDGTTQWHTVTAIDFPTMEEIQLTVTAPGYIRQDPIEKSLIPGRLRVFQGSTLNLAMKPDAPLKNLNLILTVGQANKSEQAEEPVNEILTIKPDKDGWYRFEAPLVEDFSFYPEYINVHELKNEQRRICRVHVIEDQAPVARIISPTDEIAVSADDEIEVKFEAHDDHGIAKAELIIYDDANTKEGEEPKILAVKDIPLDDQMLKKHVMGKLKLELKEFGLEEGASISYSIRVTDNREIDADPASLDEQSMVASNDRQPADETREGDRSKKSSEQSRSKPASDDDQNSATGHEAEKSDSAKESTEKSRNGVPGSEEDDNDSLVAKNDAAPRNGDSKPKEQSDGSSSSKDADDSPYVREPTDSTVAKKDPSASNELNKAESDADSLIAANKEKGAQANSKELDRLPSQESAKSLNSPNVDMANRDSANDTSQTAANGSNKRLLIAAAKDSKTDESEDVSSAGAEDDKSKNGESNSPSSQPNKDRADRDAMLADKDRSSKTADEPFMMANDAVERSDNGKNMAKRDKTATSVANNNNSQNRSKANPNSRQANGSSKTKTDKRKQMRRDSNRPNNLLPRLIQMNAQSNANQRQRNNRRRLTITDRLAAVAKQSSIERLNSRPREIVLQIDKQLLAIEKDLSLLVNKAIADDERSDRYRDLDTKAGDTEALIDDLHNETAESQFAFVGLQMVDIGRTHVTPARDGIFVSIRQPDVAADTYATESLHHVTSARELLDALLKRYDRVARDKKLESELEEKVTMYEVYIEKAHQLMSASRQNKDPLKMRRKMAVVEVDQGYLDRYAEVATLRREMMAEFGRMLTDDPRLLARYMDLIKRRGDSLRVRLREIAEQQAQLQDDVSQWIKVDDNARLDLWAYFAELRLLQASDLSRDAQAVAERIQKQLPLSLDASRGSAALVIEHSQTTALLARQCQRDAKKMLKVLGDPDADVEMTLNARAVVNELSELMAALDQLNFESNQAEGVASYVDSRLIETRTLANQADSWMEEVGSIEDVDYSKLALISQQEISIATELLRVDMLTIEDGLGTLFRELEIPQEVKNYARDLNRVMESITFNQTAAGFAISKSEYQNVVTQLDLAITRFDQAEDLIDKLRRRTAESY